jgi:hypothetical protein
VRLWRDRGLFPSAQGSLWGEFYIFPAFHVIVQIMSHCRPNMVAFERAQGPTMHNGGSSLELKCLPYREPM